MDNKPHASESVPLSEVENQITEQLLFVQKLPLVIEAGEKFTLHIYQVVEIGEDENTFLSDYVKVFIEKDGILGFIDFFICAADESYRGLRHKAKLFINDPDNCIL